MTEKRGPDHKNNEKSSSSHLNQEFRRVFESLPHAEIYEDLHDEVKNFQRRDKSEYKLALVVRLNSLLDSAKITDYFKSMIRKTFSMEYDLGIEVDSQAVILSPWPLLHNINGFKEFAIGDVLDIQNPNSGGIFDPDRAHKIETSAYNTAVAKNESFSRWMRENNEEANSFEANAQELLTNWDGQIKNLHKSE